MIEFFASSSSSNKLLSKAIEVWKEYKIGSSIEGNDLVIDSELIAGHHALIDYTESRGWCVSMLEEGSTGVWVHAKTFDDAVTGSANSSPVILRSGTCLRASTFLLKITF